MPLIDPNRIEAILIDCLFQDAEEAKAKGIIVHGIVNGYALNPVKIEEHKAEINAALDQLPDQFFDQSEAHPNGGGGYSFLAACNDKNDEQWTGLHQRMEQLFALGQATGKVEALLPKELWAALPGGMPYYRIK